MSDVNTRTIGDLLVALETTLDQALRDVTEARRDLEDRTLRTVLGGMPLIDASLEQARDQVLAVKTLCRMYSR